MSANNIINSLQAVRATEEIKKALKEAGCDVSSLDGLDDVAQIIRDECVPAVQGRLGCTLSPGPGIKVVPMGKTGYKISANSGAVLEDDLTEKLPKGSSVYKALRHILYEVVPRAMRKAAAAPSILSIDIIQVPYTGIDYYNNLAFGTRGSGKKTGLVPQSWYMRVFTYQTKEPFYVDLGVIMHALQDEILCACRHMIDAALAGNPYPCPPPPPHHPHPCPPKPDWPWEEPEPPDPVDDDGDGLCDVCGLPIENH